MCRYERDLSVTTVTPLVSLLLAFLELQFRCEQIFQVSRLKAARAIWKAQPADRSQRPRQSSETERPSQVWIIALNYSRSGSLSDEAEPLWALCYGPLYEVCTSQWAGGHSHPCCCQTVVPGHRADTLFDKMQSDRGPQWGHARRHVGPPTEYCWCWQLKPNSLLPETVYCQPVSQSTTLVHSEIPM